MQLTPISRDVVERTARVIGPASAAAAALADADSHSGPVNFFSTGHSVVVEKLPAPAGDAEPQVT